MKTVLFINCSGLCHIHKTQTDFFLYISEEKSGETRVTTLRLVQSMLCEEDNINIVHEITETVSNGISQTVPYFAYKIYYL